MTIIFVVVLLAILGVMSIPVVYENPCRLLLYYRLWEHKIVINFKNRDLSDRGTRIKMYIYLASATMLVGHGCSYRPILPLSFFLVVIQTFGAIALTVYTNLDLESTALAINRAMENYLAKQAASENQDKKKVHPAKDGTKPNKILGKTVGAISFVSEDMVMADIITLNMCFERLMAERYESRNDEQKTKKSKKRSSGCLNVHSMLVDLETQKNACKYRAPMKSCPLCLLLTMSMMMPFGTSIVDFRHGIIRVLDIGIRIVIGLDHT